MAYLGNSIDLREFEEGLNKRYSLDKKGIEVMTPDKKNVYFNKELGTLSKKEYGLAKSIANNYTEISQLNVELACHPIIRPRPIKSRQPTNCDEWQELCRDAMGLPPAIYKLAITTSLDETEIKNAVNTFMAMSKEFDKQRVSLQ